MLDACRAPSDDYAARVAAEVSARYGLTVPAAVVQVVPHGVSGLPQAVWDGQHLVYAANIAKPKGSGWRGYGKHLPESRRGLVNPDLQDRRKKVADLHAKGLSDGQIAAALGIEHKVDRADRRALQLRANLAPVKRGPRTQTEVRIDQMRRLLAEGKSRAEMAAIFGISDRTLRSIAYEARIDLPKLRPQPAVVRRERIAQLRRALDAGGSRAEICRAMGLPNRTVEALADVAGLVLPPKPEILGKPVPLSGPTARQLRLAALRAMDVSSLTLAEIVAQLEGNPRLATVREDLHELGLTPRKPTPKGIKAAHETRLSRLRRIDVSQHTVEDLVQMFGVSPVAIRKSLSKLGVSAKRLPKGQSSDQVRALEDRRARISALFKEGKTRTEVMEIVGIAASTLKKDLVALGLDVPRADGQRVVTVGAQSLEEMEALRARIRELRMKGRSIAEISDLVNRSAGTVSHHIKKLGLAGDVRGAKAAAKLERVA